jgi:hypothetical protein
MRILTQMLPGEAICSELARYALAQFGNFLLQGLYDLPLTFEIGRPPTGAWA